MVGGRWSVPPASCGSSSVFARLLIFGCLPIVGRLLIGICLRLAGGLGRTSPVSPSLVVAGILLIDDVGGGGISSIASSPTALGGNIAALLRRRARSRCLQRLPPAFGLRIFALALRSFTHAPVYTGICPGLRTFIFAIGIFRLSLRHRIAPCLWNIGRRCVTVAASRSAILWRPVGVRLPRVRRLRIRLLNI
jgi:hypothetical protein